MHWPLRQGVPEQQGVVIEQVCPAGMQQLHFVVPVRLSLLHFMQHAPSSDRQWPLVALRMVLHCWLNDPPLLHTPERQRSGGATS